MDPERLSSDIRARLLAMATPTEDRKANDHWKLQPRDPEGEDSGQWIKGGIGTIKRVGKAIAKAIDGATYTADWKGLHITAPVEGHPVTVTVTPLDVASLALMFVPGGQAVGAAATTTRVASVASKVRRALNAARAAQTIAGAVSHGGGNRALIERHHRLALAGIVEVRNNWAAQIRDPGGDGGGQWVKSLVGAVKEILDRAKADHDYGDEVGSADFADGRRVIARAGRTVTIESPVHGHPDRTEVHAAPGADDAHNWASLIETVRQTDVSGADAGPNGLREWDTDDGFLVGITDDGDIAIRFVGDAEAEDLAEDVDTAGYDGFDLTPDEADEFAAALRDMGYAAEDADDIATAAADDPDDDDADQADDADDLVDIDDDPDERAAFLRHRRLALAGVEMRRVYKRNPRGTHGGGQFLNPTTQIVDAIKNALSGPNTGSLVAAAAALNQFSQPQLKTAAGDLGLHPPKGMRKVGLASLIITFVRTNPAAATKLAAAAQMAAPSANAPAITGPGGTPGIVLVTIPPLGSVPGSQSFRVLHNGVDVGTVNHSGTGRGWTAFPPTNASYGLQGNPGSGQTFPQRWQAENALAAAHAAHAAGSAATPAPRRPATPRAPRTPRPVVTLHPVTGGFAPTVDVHVNGEYVGDIREMGGRGKWTAYVDTDKAWSVDYGRPKNVSKAAAKQQLVDVYLAHLALTGGQPATLVRLNASWATTQKFEVHVGGQKVGNYNELSSQAYDVYDENGNWTRQNSRQEAIDHILRSRQGGTAPTAAPATNAAPPGAKPIHPRFTNGYTGVTWVPSTRVSSSPWKPTREDDIYVNGTFIGTVSAHGKYWSGTTASGNSTSLGAGQTRTGNIAALVTAYVRQLATNQGQPNAPAPPAVAPPKVTFKPAPANPKDIFEVSAGGVDLGTVWNASKIMGGQAGWQADPPSGASYHVTGGSGAGHNRFKSRAAAGKALQDAYDADQAAQAAAALQSAQAAQAAAAAAVAASLSTAHVSPNVKAAQDVLYGVDPKSRTAPRQLAVYGALRRDDFDSLNTAEQSALLGDLSFIATTAKGPNADKATKLLDRFTPPGTPLGTVPTPAIASLQPLNGTWDRVKDPAGTPGLLKMLPKASRGKSGDGWTRTPSGGSGPWGQYGAAGLMLRHVDPATGEERFLMVKRGKAISDPGKWQFPGGAKEQNESFYEGAAREVIEELGFQPSDLDQARVHGDHTNAHPSVMVEGLHGGQTPWAYVSIVATVPKQLKADLSTPHAIAETEKAEWMTRAQIDKLDRDGKLLAPLAGGKIQANVLSLFPPPTVAAAGPGRPGPVTTRPPRLTGTPSAPVRKTFHKEHKGKNLIATKADQDKLRADIKAIRKNYRGKAADERLAAIASMQGFDGLPTVATKAQVDALLKSGDYIEAWRGVKPNYSHGGPGGVKSAATIAEEMRTGPAYYGTGIFGNGYYLATDKGIAQGYSDRSKNSLLRVLIPKSALADTAKYEDVLKKVQNASSSTRYKYSGSGGGHGQGTLHDEGRYAAAAGINGLRNDYTTSGPGGGNSHAARPGKPTYTWLNRTVLVIQEAE